MAGAYKPIPALTSNKSVPKEKHPGIVIIDEYERNLEELFLLRNPRHRFNPAYRPDFSKFLKSRYGKKSLKKAGSWFYYPWLNQIVHFLPDKLHQELRTGRNRYLITEEEQKKFYNAKIGVLGMSVGSHVAMVIAMTGGARHIKIADPDTLSGDNLNRIRDGYQNVGVNKAVLMARKIYEINPYAKVDVFADGLSEKNMAQFLSGLDLLVEEMDDPYLKIKVRHNARKKKIPVIMAADNGDGVIVDIERYDVNRKLPILHGLVSDIDLGGLQTIEKINLPKVIAKIAGANLASNRMLHSVTEVGKSIYSWPQLGTAANLCGSVLAYLARKIILKDSKIKSGRYDVNLDAIFEHDYYSLTNKKTRESDRAKILKKIGLL